MIRKLSLACAVAALPLRLSAQAISFDPPPDRAGTWTFDLGAQYAQPVGPFRSQVRSAWGLGGAVRKHFRAFFPLGLRADAAFLNYGNEHKRVPLSSTVNRVLVDMNTQNNIALLTAGPELMLTRGAVRPYVYGFMGYSYFYTQSSAGDDNGRGGFASTTNFGDGGLAYGWGGGMRIPLHVRSVALAIDAGARMTRNGDRTYLRRGDIVDQPDGSLLFNSRRSRADFWQFHAGVSFSPRRR